MYTARIIATAKKRPIRIAMVGFLALGLIVGIIWASGWTPLKVTDPHDPRFNPYSFRFRDYLRDDIPTSEAAFRDALEAMFPPGTPRSYVEEIFAEAGVRYKVSKQNTNIIRYADRPTLTYPGACSSFVATVEYDNDEVKAIAMVGTGLACDPLGSATWAAGQPLKPKDHSFKRSDIR